MNDSPPEQSLEAMIDSVARAIMGALDEQGYMEDRHGVQYTIVDGTFDMTKVARAALVAMSVTNLFSDGRFQALAAWQARIIMDHIQEVAGQSKIEWFPV